MDAGSSRNVIILTTGLAGSSVLSGLLSRAGLWLGEETFSKQDYRTFENLELIRLNQRLFSEVGYDGHYEMVYRPEDVALIERRSAEIDSSPYEAFLQECARHSPWLWKDPRLWLTMSFWARYLDMDNTDFVVLTREPMQSWISSTIRRQIQTPSYCRRYIADIRNTILRFLEVQEKPCLELVYEDLLVSPEATIGRLNQYLGTTLTVDDLKAVYAGELGRRQRGLPDMARAWMIYLYNYRHRYR